MAELVYGSGLENQCTEMYRGFEPHPLFHYALVVELADTLDLGSSVARRESSNLSKRTNFDFLRELPWTLDASQQGAYQLTPSLARRAAI